MNKRDMRELVRSQPKVLAKATGVESDYEVLSFARIKASEKMKTTILVSIMKHCRQAWKMT